MRQHEFQKEEERIVRKTERKNKDDFITFCKMDYNNSDDINLSYTLESVPNLAYYKNEDVKIHQERNFRPLPVKPALSVYSSN